MNQEKIGHAQLDPNPGLWIPSPVNLLLQPCDLPHSDGHFNESTGKPLMAIIQH